MTRPHAGAKGWRLQPLALASLMLEWLSSMRMRKLGTIILGLFLTGFLLSSVAPHCVLGFDSLFGGESVAAEAHGASKALHHDGGTDDQDCILSDALASANLPSALPSSAPAFKVLAVLWPMASVAHHGRSDGGLKGPYFHAAARASPPYAAAFARTGRLLI